MTDNYKLKSSYDAAGSSRGYIKKYFLNRWMWDLVIKNFIATFLINLRREFC